MRELFAQIGAVAWGAIPYAWALPHMSAQGVEKMTRDCPGAATVLVAAFPYYSGEDEGNLSLYARGMDYHQVLTNRLKQVCTALEGRYPKDTFLAAADNSPLPEVEVALSAKLGYRGRHGLLIVPPYGSYVFLGTILTSATLSTVQGTLGQGCMDCGACLAACPTRARHEEGFTCEICLSHVSQQKGELPPDMAQALAEHPLIWGCDTCQQVCPYNREVPLTTLPEFREALITSLSQADLEGLTNRTFQEKYGHRAFAWRGASPLRRNLIENVQKRC